MTIEEVNTITEKLAAEWAALTPTIDQLLDKILAAKEEATKAGLGNYFRETLGEKFDAAYPEFLDKLELV